MSTQSNRNGLLIAVAVVVILIPLGYSVVSPLFAQDAGADQPFLERPDAKHESCVRETTYMRFHHWELLREIREEVVRYGQRGDVGLKKCTECHTSRERFCNQCHNAVNLYPDCFGCHYYE
ncbi:MAG: hypothetical protein ACYTFA_04960 [Planctomycetota bacterium]|jgi:hypothetical protein